MPKNFIVATDIEDAVKLKTKDSAYIAGGTEVNRLDSSIEAETLISISKLGLNSIEKEGSFLSIGSCVTFQSLMDSPLVPSYLKEGASFMFSMQRRNMATIGGNIALARDDSYLCPTLLASGARLVLADGRELGAWDYLATDINGALILKVIVPMNAKVKSLCFANTASSHAVLTASACLCDNGETRLAFVLKGCGIACLEAPSFGSEEDALNWAKSFDGLDFESDMYGSQEYKRYLLGVSAYDLMKALER